MEIEKERNSIKLTDEKAAVALWSLYIITIMILRKIICLDLIMDIKKRSNHGRNGSRIFERIC